MGTIKPRSRSLFLTKGAPGGRASNDWVDGSGGTPASGSVLGLDRCFREKIIIETAHEASGHDGHVQLLARGKSALVKRHKLDARRAFREALALFPYHGESWLWLARSAIGDRLAPLAEVACRTACAYGVASEDVRPLLETISPEAAMVPLHRCRPGPAALQAPGEPDIQLLARVAWCDTPLSPEEALPFLRNCGTIDAVLATMVADPRFEAAHQEWLSVKARTP